MSLVEIEKKLSQLTSNINEEKFIFDFLLAYNHPKATIRIIKGDYNQSNKTNELIWKKKYISTILKT